MRQRIGILAPAISLGSAVGLGRLAGALLKQADDPYLRLGLEVGW